MRTPATAAGAEAGAGAARWRPRPSSKRRADRGRRPRTRCRPAERRPDGRRGAHGPVWPGRCRAGRSLRPALEVFMADPQPSRTARARKAGAGGAASSSAGKGRSTRSAAAQSAGRSPTRSQSASRARGSSTTSARGSANGRVGRSASIAATSSPNAPSARSNGGERSAASATLNIPFASASIRLPSPGAVANIGPVRVALPTGALYYGGLVALVVGGTLELPLAAGAAVAGAVLGRRWLRGAVPKVSVFDAQPGGPN